MTTAAQPNELSENTDLLLHMYRQMAAIANSKRRSTNFTRDHRVVDGARAAEFLRDLVAAISNPQQYFNDAGGPS
jgi:hypothetical protein